MPPTVLSPGRDPVPTLESFLPQAFEIREIDADDDGQDYDRLLRETYEPMGFMRSEILPVAGSRRFRVLHGDAVVAIFRLTPVADAGSPYFALVPNAVTASGRRARLVEVNNVVIAAPFRATILLGLLLYRSATAAHEMGGDFVVRLTRLQTLRFFVDFGVVPVDHPPLRLMGKEHLLDFVIYYDTRSRRSIDYMHERARRYFHQQYVMKSIQQKYLGRSGRSASSPQQASALTSFNAGLPELQPC